MVLGALGERDAEARAESGPLDDAGRHTARRRALSITFRAIAMAAALTAAVIVLGTLVR